MRGCIVLVWVYISLHFVLFFCKSILGRDIQNQLVSILVHWELMVQSHRKSNLFRWGFAPDPNN